MKQLLYKISNERIDDKLYSEVKIKIEGLYDKRLSYSEIAQFVFENKDIDYLIENLDSIRGRGLVENNRVLVKCVGKIKDHVELEAYRLKHLEETQKRQVEKISEETLGKFKPMDEKINRYEQIAKKHEETMTVHEATMKEHRKEIKNWNANIVTVLGLFSAIVVTFFGGMSGINSIFTNINSISFYRLTFVILVVILAMFNIIFMLLYYIGIITGKHLNRECKIGCNKFEKKENIINDENKINTCNNKKLRCCFKRYPIIMYFNLVIVLMFIGMGSLYEINRIWIK